MSFLRQEGLPEPDFTDQKCLDYYKKMWSNDSGTKFTEEVFRRFESNKERYKGDLRRAHREYYYEIHGEEIKAQMEAIKHFRTNS